MSVNPLAFGAGMAAIPLLASAFMPRPDMPKAPDYSQALAMLNSPDLQRARSQILASGFDPQSQLYQLAGGQAMANMNRVLAQRGLGNSGVGLQALSQSQTDLANAYIQNQLSRQMQAYQAATAPLQAIAGIQTQAANGQYQNAMQGYANQVQGQQGLISALTGGLGAGMSAYQYGQQMDNQQNQFNQMMALLGGKQA